MYIKDFVKTFNLQILNIGNEMCFNTFTQMYSSIWLCELGFFLGENAA